MLVTLLGVGGYFYWRLDDEIRGYAEGYLAKHYTQLDVRVGSAKFEAGRGVTLHRLTLSERGADGSLLPLVEVEELQLLGKFDMQSLVLGKPEIQQIIVRQPHLRAVRHLAGDWNLQALLPPPASSDKPAAIEIVNASLTLVDQQHPQTDPLLVDGINLKATSKAAQITTAPSETAKYLVEVEGTVDGSLANSFSFGAELNPSDGGLTAWATLDGVKVNTPLLRSLPGLPPALLERSELTGKANLQISASRLSGQEMPITWETNFQFSEGRLIVDKLPRHVRSITFEGTATQEMLKITAARAKYGKADFLLACNRYGWAAEAPLALQARATDFMLDKSLGDLLPPALAKIRDRYHPVGKVGANFILRYNGQKWLPDLTVQFHNVDFEDGEKFPYRARHGQGIVRYYDPGDGNGARLDVNLQAQAGDRSVAIEGHLVGMASLGGPPRPQPPGWFEVRGEQLLITDALVNALPMSSSKVVRSFDPHGRFSLRWFAGRKSAGGSLHTETDLTFHNGQVKYDKFPYPLSHINGQLHEREGQWEFKDLVSRDPDGTREIQCHGTCIRTSEGRQLAISFTGTEVALDDTLRLALPDYFQTTWAAFRPTGRVGFRADVRHQAGDPKPDIQLNVQPLRQTVSIEPTFFRYRFEKLEGSLAVINGNVTMTGLRAAHGQTTFAADGTWGRTAQGGWQFDLTNLQVDRLSADLDLVLASPRGLRKVIESLKPEGNFAIHNGRLRFTRALASSTHLRSEWNVQLGCQQNHLELGIPIDNLSGIVHLTGRQEGNSSFTAGRLEIDSAFWNGFQLTNVRGPLWVDNEECRLGRGATQKLNEIQRRNDPQQPIEANLYGGGFSLDANVQFDSRGRYTVATKIEKTDLQRLSTECFGSSVDMTGSLSADMTLTGVGRSIDLMEGGGTLAIRDAEMYELPAMARLLKVLRNRLPDKTAFNGVDAQFALAGRDIRFDKLNLLGDAISLYGKGTATVDKQLNLAFHTTVGRNDFNLPVISSLIGQASANLLLVKVVGTVDNPKIEREVLPAVNGLVEQLNEGSATVPTREKKSFWRR